jgi:hypothetical protein
MVKLRKLIVSLFISLLLLPYGCSKKEKEGVSEKNAEQKSASSVHESTKLTQEQLTGDRLRITKFSPDLPATIAVGERLIITVEYDINSVEEAQIFVRPYTKGKRTHDYRAHGCRPIEKSKGVMKGYFTFDEPTIVDEVRVKMVNAKDQSQICTSIFKEISAQWLINP